MRLELTSAITWLDLSSHMRYERAWGVSWEWAVIWFWFEESYEVWTNVSNYLRCELTVSNHLIWKIVDNGSIIWILNLSKKLSCSWICVVIDCQLFVLFTQCLGTKSFFCETSWYNTLRYFSLVIKYLNMHARFYYFFYCTISSCIMCFPFTLIMHIWSNVILKDSDNERFGRFKCWNIFFQWACSPQRSFSASEGTNWIKCAFFTELSWFNFEIFNAKRIQIPLHVECLGQTFHFQTQYYQTLKEFDHMRLCEFIAVLFDTVVITSLSPHETV